MNMKCYKNFDVSMDDRGVVRVSLDVPDRPLNILTQSVMGELERVIGELEHNADAKVVLFCSGKESGFLAGAEVGKIAEIASAREATRLIVNGQTLFQRIAWLPMPTIAVIHGPCLGGGLELSLACDFRVARDNSSTKIGLPEIKLGLIPGWGGTQRLPQVVGLTEALGMILTGKHLSARDAMSIGLVDSAIDPDAWEEQLEAFTKGVLDGRSRSRTGKGPLWRRLLESNSLTRSVIFRMTEKKITSKKDQYPALAAAVRAIRKSYEKGPQGFQVERDEFVELLATETCRNLLSLFFARERARRLATWSSDALGVIHLPPIQRVGIVGAGAMGAGIGQLCVLRGFDAVMKEINEETLQAGRQRVEKLIRDLARRKAWKDAKRDELLDKVKYTCDDNDLADCDLVIEAVVEREDIKREVFANLDRTVQPTAILASNTSSLRVGDMADATLRPSHVAGLHFFNPVHRMELVEIVQAESTDTETMGRLASFVKALGKTPVVTSDSPGFLVNRVLFPYLGEAIRMVGEGTAPDKIDREIRRFGMPMGPLELLDHVGLDVALHVSKSLKDVLCNVKPIVGQLAAMVDEGKLGKKSGRGFYLYKQGKKSHAIALSAPTFERPRELRQETFDRDGLTLVQRRLVYPMLIESIRCHQEGVVQQAWAIDLAMVLGTGFAPHRGGPLHTVDSIGLTELLQNCRTLESQLGERFSPPQELLTMALGGRTFFGADGTTPQHQSSPSSS